MFKKIRFWVISLILLGLIGWGGYLFLFIPHQGLRPIYVVPKDAIYIIESQEPVNNWEKISTSSIWNHLQQNNYFASLTYDANVLDTLFKENKTLMKLFGSRSLTISAHMYKPNDYDFLFILDLQKASKLATINNYLSAVISNDFKITRRTYHEREILELFDKQERETLYLSIIDNLLIASYTHLLVEASIDEVVTPKIGRDVNFLEVANQLDNGNLFKLYVQYAFLDDFLKIYTQNENEYVKSFTRVLKYSGFSFELDENNWLTANGYTKAIEDSLTYLHVLNRSGKGKISIPKIAPQRTGFYLGLGFKDFSKFYDNLEEIQQQDKAAYRIYKESYDKIEKLLKISIRENFIDWVDDEIAFLQMQPSGLGEKNEFAIVLKTKDEDDARENLDFILKQIKRKTPVKFKQVTYKGYPINFMSVKGFFKLLLGKFFADLEKPYFTIMDGYVIFSNHPQTLKNIINDYQIENTLASSKEFEEFMDHFESNSNLFVFVNTPILHKNIKSLVSSDTRHQLDINKPFITCFSQIGYQLIPDDALIESKLVLQYLSPEDQEKRIQFASSPEKLMLSSFGKMFEEEPLPAASSNVVLLNMVEEEELIKVEEISPEDLDANMYEEFYDSGELKIEVPLKDGLKHGTYREYYENGNIKLKGKYRNDNQTGVWKAYDEDGQTIERIRF